MDIEDDYTNMFSHSDESTDNVKEILDLYDESNNNEE